jgi:hypothetical protein
MWSTFSAIGAKAEEAKSALKKKVMFFLTQLLAKELSHANTFWFYIRRKI